jgi:hypothetical protein
MSKKRRTMVRLPNDLAEWMAALAEHNGTSISGEISRHFRQLMDADGKAKAQADRAAAGE